MTRPRWTLIALVVWGLAALAFASWRIPFGDEWFSITLARDTTWGQFWASLRDDYHPPWVALLDRALWSERLGWLPHRVLRIAAAGGAVALVLPLLQRFVTHRSAAWFVVLAWHPLLFMYAAALRYYPLLFLAQALRAWGLWVEPTTSRRGRAAMISGAMIGCACFYADLAFVLLDLAFYSWRARSVRLALATLGLCALSWISPLWPQPLELVAVAMRPHPLAAVSWLALGSIGEFHLPGAWMLLALVTLPGYWVLVRWSLRTATPHVLLWFACTCVGWLALASVATPQPRYSLLVWSVTVGLGCVAWQEGSRRRLALAATGGYLALGLVLMWLGIGAVRDDLATLPHTVCDALQRASPVDLIIAPYPRTREQIVRMCRPTARVETLRSGRHVDSRDEQLAPLAAALAAARDVELVTLPGNTSSLAVTQARVLSLLASRCTQGAALGVGHDPLMKLKAWFAPDRSDAPLWMVARWRCPRR